MGFPGGSVVKSPPASAGDVGSFLEMRRLPGKQNDDPLQYSCLKNLMNKGAWWSTVHGVMRVGLDLVTSTFWHGEDNLFIFSVDDSFLNSIHSLT